MLEEISSVWWEDVGSAVCVELCMGRLFVEQLEGHVYSCKHCRMHLAHVEELVSKVCDAQERGTRRIRCLRVDEEETSNGMRDTHTAVMARCLYMY